MTIYEDGCVPPDPQAGPGAYDGAREIAYWRDREQVSREAALKIAGRVAELEAQHAEAQAESDRRLRAWMDAESRTAEAQEALRVIAEDDGACGCTDLYHGTAHVESCPKLVARAVLAKMEGR